MIRELLRRRPRLKELDRERIRTFGLARRRDRELLYGRDRSRAGLRLIALGAYLEAKTGDDPKAIDRILDGLDGFLTRPTERELFGLLPLPPTCLPTYRDDALTVHMCGTADVFHALTAPLWDDLWAAESGDGDAASAVPWSASRNLSGAPWADALDIMADTVARAKGLKRANGVRGGTEVKKPACHYALYWPANETPGREHMAHAAEGSLKALGVERHQALLLAHGDPAHPHLHVVVNRVDPETGRAPRLGGRTTLPYWEVLARWAAAYRPAPAERIPASPISAPDPVPPDAA